MRNCGRKALSSTVLVFRFTVSFRFSVSISTTQPNMAAESWQEWSGWKTRDMKALGTRNGVSPKRELISSGRKQVEAFLIGK